MKKLLSILMVAVLSFTMVGCGSSPSPTETADSFMKAVQAIDLDGVTAVYDDATEDDKVANLDEEDKQLLEDIKNSELSKLFQFDYELNNEKIDGEKATVDVKVTTYSMEKAFKNFMPKFVEFAMSEESSNMNEDQMMKKVMKMAEKEFSKLETKDFTGTATINLVQRDGQWKVAILDDNDKFLNAITGGLLDLVNNMDDYL